MVEFFKGIAIGLCVSVPVGPIGILCMNYALSRGFRVAVIAGLGAAIADIFYGTMAGLGVYSANSWIDENSFWIALVGSFFLCGLGMTLIKGPIQRSKVEIRPAIGEFKAFGATFFLTLTNPLTLISFATLFGCTHAIPESCSSHEILTLISGVFTGSMLWWITLSSCTSFFRERISFAWIAAFRRGAGFGVIGFGLFTFFYSLTWT